QMLEKARKNVESGSYANVEFRLGEIEHLPVADSSVDVIISNCVINLSPDKPAVFSEAYRVLRPGGRIMVSDIVITRDLPDPVKRLADAYTGCISGASRRDAYLDCITSAGFLDIAILDEKTFPIDFITSDPEIRGLSPDLLEGLKESVKSIRVRAIKPR
ncbi:MAG: methyltransferase domain-containing protein, partial [Methanoregulaceae archaeon]